MSMQFTYETELTYQGTEYYAEVFIDVTNVVVVKPDHTTWDSDYDYYGYKELDFEVIGVELYNDDGECLGYLDDKKQIEELGLDYDKIEVWLWEQLEDMGDDGGY